MLRKPYGWKKEGGREGGRTPSSNPSSLKPLSVISKSIIATAAIASTLISSPWCLYNLPVSHGHCRDPSETQQALLVLQTNYLLPKRKQFSAWLGHAYFLSTSHCSLVTPSQTFTSDTLNVTVLILAFLNLPCSWNFLIGKQSLLFVKTSFTSLSPHHRLVISTTVLSNYISHALI